MPRTIHREQKTEPFWRDLIARWRASGQTVAAFCALLPPHAVLALIFDRRRLARRVLFPDHPACRGQREIA